MPEREKEAIKITIATLNKQCSVSDRSMRRLGDRMGM